MKKKRNTEKKVRCIVYISTVGDMQHVNQREQRQMRYISEYANGNNIEVVKVMRRNVLGQLDVNKHYDRMVQMVSEGFADGILIANMQLMMTDWIFSLMGCHMAVRVDKYLNERKSAFLLIEILYRKGEINEETFKNVKDLEVQEFGQSTSLTKRMFS